MKTDHLGSSVGHWVIRILAVGYLLIACWALFMLWLLKVGWAEFHPQLLFLITIFGGTGVLCLFGARREWRGFHLTLLLIAPIPLMWLMSPVAEAWQFRGCQEYLRSWENQLSAEYDLRFHSLSIEPDVTSVDYALRADSRGHPVLTDELIGFVKDGRNSLDFEFTNRSGEPLSINWPDARYIDEFGESHPVIVSREGQPNPFAEHDNRPTVLKPWEQLRYISVVPRYKLKTDVCTDQGVLWGKQEQLVPSDLATLTREEAMARLGHLADKKVPVQLLIPITARGTTLTYRFLYALESRYGERTEDEVANTDRVLATIQQVYSTANYSGSE